MNTSILSLWYYIPKMKQSSDEVENIISESFPSIERWIIKEMTWVDTRHYVWDDEYASDLAIKASKIAMEKIWYQAQKIDLLIFASASHDITEPATANIIQTWLWLCCPVFDVKNACNSFLNGLEIADSMIKSWNYTTILICSWETPSKTIKFQVENRNDFKNHFAWYTFWDAWSAIIVSWNTDKKGILLTYFYSDGQCWDIATIMWWWSRYPRDLTKNYFFWNPWRIRDMFISLWGKQFKDWLKKLNWSKNDITKIFVHQVSMGNFQYLVEELEVEYEKFHIILPSLWNIASCCIPVSLAQYMENNTVESWDKFIFIWFASGFSYWLIYYEV